MKVIHPYSLDFRSSMGLFGPDFRNQSSATLEGRGSAFLQREGVDFEKPLCPAN